MTTGNDMANDGAYIKRRAFIISTSTLLALTLVSTTVHSLVHFHRTKTIKLSTIFLLLSTLTLTASTATLQLGLSPIYLATSQSTINAASPPPPSAIPTAESALRYATAAQALLWTSIFATKTALLLFSTDLLGGAITLLPSREKRHQYAVLAAILSTWAFHLCIPSIVCPHHHATSEPNAQFCLTNSTAKVLSYTSAPLDVLTTLLVLSLPILHHQQIRKLHPTKPLLSFALIFIASTTILSILRSTLHPTSPPFTLFLLHTSASTYLLLLTTLLALLTLSSRPSLPSSSHGASLTLRPTESQEQLRAPGVAQPAPRAPAADADAEAAVPGIRTVIEGGAGGGLRRPARLVKSSVLRRQESVLRTREVRVEVHCAREGEDWGRVASPSWMDEKWRVRPESSSAGSSAAGAREVEGEEEV